MAWQKHELEAMVASRLFYLDWIADLEAGNDPITTRRSLGVLIDDREESLARYRRNAEEIASILEANGIPYDA